MIKKTKCYLKHQAGDTAESLGLTGFESYDVAIPEVADMKAGFSVKVTVDGGLKSFTVMARLDTEVEVRGFWEL